MAPSVEFDVGMDEDLPSTLQSSETYFPIPDDKPIVIFAILCVDGWVRLEHYRFSFKLMKLNIDPEFPFAFLPVFITGAKPASFAHNLAVNACLMTPKGQYLWLWANDMIPTPYSLALFNHLDEADILCPNVRIWHESKLLPSLTAAVASESEPGKFVLADFHYSDKPYPIEAAGSGGLLIHRKVLEDRAMHYAPMDGGVPCLFRDFYRPRGDRTMGHDFEFTQRAHELGYRIITVPQALCGHIKEVDLERVFEYGVKLAGLSDRADDVFEKIRGWLRLLAVQAGMGAGVTDTDELDGEVLKQLVEHIRAEYDVETGAQTLRDLAMDVGTQLKRRQDIGTVDAARLPEGI